MVVLDTTVLWIHDTWFMVRVLTKRPMLTRWGFLRSSSSCVFFMVSPAVPALIFYCFPQVPVGLWVHSGGGLWSSGDIRGTSLGFLQRYEPWGITDVASLFLGNIAHKVCLSLVSLCGVLINLCISYFASTRMGDSLEWYSYMMASS